jgi:hypothetical protein
MVKLTEFCSRIACPAETSCIFTETITTQNMLTKLEVKGIEPSDCCPLDLHQTASLHILENLPPKTDGFGA